MKELYYHVHHEVLFEPLIEAIENRIKYILENKPLNEIETRLRLLKPVRGNIKIPIYCKEAAAKRYKAYAKWKEANAKWREATPKRYKAYAKWAEWEEADAKWKKAYAKWESSPEWKDVEILHKKECPNCPWNGETIFPKEKE